MKNRLLVTMLIISTLFSVSTESAYAVGFKEGGASLLLPTTGQAVNGEIGRTKTKIMGGVEVALVSAMFVLGTAFGGPVVWVAAAPLVGNHVWSASDAFITARRNHREAVTNQLYQNQQRIDLDHQENYKQQSQYRSDIRERVRLAGQLSAQG